MLDIVRSDAYSVLELTDAVNKLPYVPGRIGELGIFEEKGQVDRFLQIEEQEGTIALVQSAQRGSTNQRTARSTDARRLRLIPIPHFPLWDTIIADDMTGRRKFGTENDRESPDEIINDRLSRMKQDLEATREYLKLGALKGIILDADGSTLCNLFTEFDITAATANLDFTANATDMKKFCAQVVRHMQNALGDTRFTGIRAFCGNQFWDNFIAHADVKNAYDKFVDSNQWFLRAVPLPGPATSKTDFSFGDILWENYRGSIGTAEFVPSTKAFFFPTGVPDMFIGRHAPADFTEAVGTVGLPMYAKREMLKWDKGVELHVQMNTIYVVKRPKCLLTVTGTNMTASPTITNAAT